MPMFVPLDGAPRAGDNTGKDVVVVDEEQAGVGVSLRRLHAQIGRRSKVGVDAADGRAETGSSGLESNDEHEPEVAQRRSG